MAVSRICSIARPAPIAPHLSKLTKLTKPVGFRAHSRPAQFTESREATRPPEVRLRPNAALLPVNSAQWALGGFYLSLRPTLAAGIVGNNAPLVGEALIAALTFSSAATILP